MPYSEKELEEFRNKDRKAHENGKARVDMSQVPVTQKRPDHGKPRPQAQNTPRIPVGFKVALKDSSLPLRYFESHKSAASEACCRELDNLVVQHFKSSKEATKPDFLAIECTACGRSHYRGAQGSSRLG